MIKTEEYMSAPVVQISPSASIDEAAKIMDEKNIGCLVVTEKGVVKGIMTERDIMRKVVAKGKDTHDVKVLSIMTKEVITVKKEASLMEVAALMKQHVMRRIVVMDESTPVGIITSRDLVDLLV